METQKNQTSYKFLISDYKDILNNIVFKSPLLKTYWVSSSNKDIVTKYYYDTDDLFFKNNGINININIYKGKKTAELVVRYNKAIKQINFLSDVPNKFIKQINKKDRIYMHFEYIAKSIEELCPKGLNVNLLEKLEEVRLKLKVVKKREQFRIIHNNGLKFVLSFEQNVYSNHSGDSIKLNIMEVLLDSEGSTQPLFEKFLHELKLTEYRLIETKSSDLFVGMEYLDI